MLWNYERFRAGVESSPRFISWEQLSKDVGVSPQTLRNIRAGHSTPSVAVVAKVLQHLNLDWNVIVPLRETLCPKCSGGGKVMKLCKHCEGKGTTKGECPCCRGVGVIR